MNWLTTLSKSLIHASKSFFEMKWFRVGACFFECAACAGASAAVGRAAIANLNLEKGGREGEVSM